MADNWTPPSDAEVVEWTPPSDAQATDESVKKKVVTTPSEFQSQDGAKVLSDVSEQFRKAGTQVEKPLSESGTTTKKLVEDTPTYEDKQQLSATDIANEKKRLEKMPTSASMLLESEGINAISSDIVRNKNISAIASQDPNVLKLNSLILERDKAIQANEGKKVADLSSQIDGLKNSPVDTPIDLQQQLQQHNLQYSGAPQDKPQDVSGFKPQTLNDKLVANKAKPVKTVGELHDLSNEAQKKVSELEPELDKIKIPFDEQVAQLRKENRFKSTEENGVRRLEGFADTPEAFVLGARNTFKDGLGAIKQLFGTKEDRQNYSDQRALEDNILYPTETKGVLTSGAEMAGGVAPYVATGALGGESIVGQILSNGLTMGATGIGSAYHQEYQKQKALGLTPDEADKVALEKSAFHGGTQAVLGGSLPFLGSASKSILMHPEDVKLLERFAEESALGKPYAYNAKNVKASLKGFGSEMGGIQTAFAGEHITNNAFDKYVLGDKNKNLLEGTADVVIQGGLLHLGMHVLPSAPKAIKDIYEVNFSKRYPSIQQAVDMAMQEGKITPQQADAITVPLEKNFAIYNAMPEGLTAEQMVSIKPETEQILELSKKEPSAVENPEITKDRIAQLQKTISEKLGTPLTEKEQKAYEKLLERQKPIKSESGKEITLELLPSEKAELNHYEKRIKTAEDIEFKLAEEKKVAEAEAPLTNVGVEEGSVGVGGDAPLKENEYYHATDNNEILAPSDKGYKKREGNNVVGEGIYFGKDKEHLTDRYGENIIKVELDIKNPLVSDNKYIVVDGREIDVQSLSKDDINFLKEKGYDAIKYVAADKAYSKFNETIVFDKSQIKKSEQSLKETTQSETKVAEKGVEEQTPPALKDVESTAKVIEDGDKWYKAEKSVKDKDGNDITLTIDKNKDTNHFYIKAKDNKGNEIGSALFETDNGKVWSGNEIEVNEGNRRKGIMSVIYDFAESEGHPLEPTKSLSKEGKAFWENRKSQTLLSKEQPTSTTQSEIEAKKADIERRRQEVERLSNKELTSPIGKINTGKIEIPILPSQNIDKTLYKDGKGVEYKVKANFKNLQDVLLGRNGKYLFRGMQGRFFVLAKVGDFYLPFYISSAGTSGKKQGEWYPFFGYTGNWLVKGRVGNKGEMEYSQKISEVQKLLQENLQFPSRFLNLKGEMKVGDNVIYDINQDFNYIEHFTTFGDGTVKREGDKYPILKETLWIQEITGFDPRNVDNDGKGSADTWINDIIALIENAPLASKGKINAKYDAELKQRFLEDADLYRKVKGIEPETWDEKLLQNESDRLIGIFEDVNKINQFKDKTVEEVADGKELVISQNIGKIKRDGFLEHNDRNNITMGLAKSYFSKDGMSVDALAKEISDKSGLDISPSDITDFMTKYPDGVGGENSLSEKTFMGANSPKKIVARMTADLESLLGEKLTPERQQVLYEKYQAIQERLSEINAKEVSESEVDKLNQKYNDYLNTLTDEQRNYEQSAEQSTNESEQDMEGEKDAETKSIEGNDRAKSEGNGEGRKAEGKAESPNKEVGGGEVSSKQKALDRLAEAKKKREEFIDKKNKLGSSKDAFSEAEEQAKIDRELFDAYVNTAKEYIKEGVKSAKEWAESIGEELTDTIKKAWDEANAGNKKRVLTERAYEGSVRDDVKAYLEKKGLYREKFTQEERKAQAKEYISEFGEEMALESVKYGEAKGALAAAILTETQKSINAERLKLKNTDTVELDELAQKEAEIISILGEYAYEGGEFNAYLDKVYKEDVGLGYSYEKKVKEWKDLNGGEISPEVESKFKDLDNQMQELKKKLADAEVKLKEEKEKQSFEDIKESVRRKPSKSDVIEAKKAKAKADIGEALNEISDVLGIKLSAVGDKKAELTKALVKLGNGLIDLGEANAQNVVEKIKERVERQFKGKVNFSEHEKNLIDAFEKERPRAILKNGKLVIPDKLIRNLVENGIDNIEDLTKSIKDIVSDEMPDITDREIRDAITRYGKVINPPKDTVSKQIGKIKDIGRILSQLEDIANKKRPLKSGLQREKLDAEQRAKHKELREALKELPLDDEALANEIRSIQDTKKARLQNRIEDLQREIDTKTKTEKSKRNIEDDAEIKQLREQLESVKAEHDKEFADQNEAEKESKRLNTAKKNAQRRIEDLQRKLREGDFSKVEKKPMPVDEEITKLKAEKLRIQDEYDKEFHKNKLKNRTKWEVTKDHVWEMWGITRALRATGEMSYVGVQGLVQTIAHPMIAARAFKNSIKFMASEQHTEQWLRELKTQEYYPTLKESKLSISEPNAELSAREELFYSGWTNILWDSIGTPLKLKSKEAYDKWVSANPMKAIERGAVGYLDTIRVERFLDGMEMLQAQGKTMENDKDSYKNMADVINTFTGRASLGAMEQIAPQLSKVFFSPRNWASALKTTLLLPRQIAKWQNGEWKPTVANKMAISDLSKFVGTTTGMVMMASVALNNDDRDDTYVETDPRSSDFGKIRIGDIRIDPWGGKIQQIVLASRMVMGETKSTTNGKISPLGSFGKPTREELLIEQATNKLAPSASMLHKYLTSKVNKSGERTDKYGNDYSIKDDFIENLTPIYWGSTVPELLKDDPSALNGILAFYAFFGGGVNVYGKKKEKKKD